MDTKGGSFLASLAVAEGDVLIYVESHGATPFSRLTQELKMPEEMVSMAVGVLARAHLVDVGQAKGANIVRPHREPWQTPAEPIPEVWVGG